MSAVSGSPTQVKTSCATLAEMGGTPDDAFLDGEVAYVSSVRRYFQIVRDDPTLIANGSTVVATFSGNGYWVALDFQSDSWSYQSTWYINATTGDDENDGATSATALRSWAEFHRRVSHLEVSMTVYVASNLAEAIKGTFTSASPTLTLTVRGVPTVLATSDVATTFVNPTGNARGTVSAGTIDFSLYVTKFARVVNTDQVLPITSNAGAVGRGGFWANTGFSTAKPANGTIIEVLDLPTVLTVQLFSEAVAIRVMYLRLTGTSTSVGLPTINVNTLNYGGVGAYPHWFACHLGDITSSMFITLVVGCLFTKSSGPMLIWTNDAMNFTGGGSTCGVTNVGYPGTLFFSGFLAEAGSGTFSMSGGAQVSDAAASPLGIFTTATAGLVLSGAGTVFASGGTTYGTSSGAGGAGVTIANGARLSIASGTPSITGATNDFTVDGATSLVAPPTAGGVWAAAVDLSGAAGVGWGKWVAAGRKFVNYATGSTVSN